MPHITCAASVTSQSLRVRVLNLQRDSRRFPLILPYSELKKMFLVKIALLFRYFIPSRVPP